jgi:hypothetical protein
MYRSSKYGPLLTLSDNTSTARLGTSPGVPLLIDGGSLVGGSLSDDRVEDSSEGVHCKGSKERFVKVGVGL